MNLHVFNDHHGYNLNLVIDRCNSAGGLEKNVFINLNKKTLYKNNKAKYLKTTFPSFKKFIQNLPALDTITLCPLDHVSAYFLIEIKKVNPNARVNWIFWSYEFYQEPEKYKSLLLDFSLAYYEQQKSILNSTKNTFKSYVKTILTIPVYDRKITSEARKKVNTIYSFLPQDFKNIADETNNDVYQYQPISFLSLEQITKNIQGGVLSDEIIIGHSCRLTGNHAEALKMLSQISFDNKIFIPLTHGDIRYAKLIKQQALDIFGKKAGFLEEELDMQSYFKRLSTIGFAVFNFIMQEGLGNIIFLLWNGAKIFLRKESNVYLQFKEWGLQVYSLQDDLNEMHLREHLEKRYVDQNKKILESLLSEEKVKEYWAPLFK